MIIETDEVRKYLQFASDTNTIKESDKEIIYNFIEMIEAYYQLSLAKTTLDKFAGNYLNIKAKEN